MSLAVAKAIIKLRPNSKALLKKFNLLKTDPRKVERKHVGRYKARKKYPYNRR